MFPQTLLNFPTYIFHFAIINAWSCSLTRTVRWSQWRLSAGTWSVRWGGMYMGWWRTGRPPADCEQSPREGWWNGPESASAGARGGRRTRHPADGPSCQHEPSKTTHKATTDIKLLSSAAPGESLRAEPVWRLSQTKLVTTDKASVWFSLLLIWSIGFEILLLLLLHPFNGLFSRTTWVSRYRKGKTSLDLNEARDDGLWGCSGISWTICKQSKPRSRQITTPHNSIFTGRMLFLTPN